jgi:hypothetical protein
MTTVLCPIVPASFNKAEVFDDFFETSEGRKIRGLEDREQPKLGVPGESCSTNLFFGFFFDGTKNNYVLAETGLNHSNVARLYDCYPGLSVPGVLPASTDWQYKPSNYAHFFKTYIPGVSSPFKEISDSGEGFEGQQGAAMGFRGEARIVWALIQAINNVHRYFHKSPLVSAAETEKLTMSMDLTARRRRALGKKSIFPNAREKEDGKTREEFEKILRRLHGAVNQHWPDKKTGRPSKIDPGIVQTIHVSIFGFSRGATQARAFANWLTELCRLDASMARRGDTVSLGGFKLEIDFLGLFDTVASVGAGNTFGNSWLGRLFDGHGTWADSEGNLRIPEGIRCVHLVAAHEVRRSFPLDSICVGSVAPANSQEIVFPGVHSDLGCGYSPCEQGRGLDRTGADMLARIPLLFMYKEARSAGVPLKLEFASEAARKRFQITPAAISALNSYLSQSPTKTGTLTSIMREQARLHIQWRLARRPTGNQSLESTQSFARASTFDQNDLHSANLEFEKEVAAFETWLAHKGKGFVPTAQAAGFGNEYENEWEEIARWWAKTPPPSSAVLNFFDEYVHDSRAWFKLIPGNPDNEAGMHILLRKQLATLQANRERNLYLETMYRENQKALVRLGIRSKEAGATKYQPQPLGFSEPQIQALDEYARTGKIPRMLTEGREPFEIGGIAGRAGYLRFRKVYGGRDSVLISQAGEIGAEERKTA